MTHTAHQVLPVHRQEPPVGRDSDRLGGALTDHREETGPAGKVIGQLHVAGQPLQPLLAVVLPQLFGQACGAVAEGPLP